MGIRRHCHQTGMVEAVLNWSKVSAPLRVGCHSAASSGSRSLSEARRRCGGLDVRIGPIVLLRSEAGPFRLSGRGRYEPALVGKADIAVVADHDMIEHPDSQEISGLGESRGECAIF